MDELIELYEELKQAFGGLISIGQDSIIFPFDCLRARIDVTEEPLPYKVYIQEDKEWVLRAELFFLDEAWGILEIWNERRKS